MSIVVPPSILQYIKNGKNRLYEAEQDISSHKNLVELRIWLQHQVDETFGQRVNLPTKLAIISKEKAAITGILAGGALLFLAPPMVAFAGGFFTASGTLLVGAKCCADKEFKVFEEDTRGCSKLIKEKLLRIAACNDLVIRTMMKRKLKVNDPPDLLKQGETKTRQTRVLSC